MWGLSNLCRDGVVTAFSRRLQHAVTAADVMSNCFAVSCDAVTWRHADGVVTPSASACHHSRQVSYGSFCRNKSTSRPKDKALQYQQHNTGCVWSEGLWKQFCLSEVQIRRKFAHFLFRMRKEYCCVFVYPSNRILDRHAHWCHMASTVKLLCVAAMNESATSDGECGYFDANYSMSLH